mmetsp:Transcript_84186/g.212295  ORF Transcript_84186/g.212295 Transcript_84186/m.212295 type:complete len:204 (-) Transcript_84186:442-1053(-)
MRPNACIRGIAGNNFDRYQLRTCTDRTQAWMRNAAVSLMVSWRSSRMVWPRAFSDTCWARILSTFATAVTLRNNCCIPIGPTVTMKRTRRRARRARTYLWMRPAAACFWDDLLSDKCIFATLVICKAACCMSIARARPERHRTKRKSMSWHRCILAKRCRAWFRLARDCSFTTNHRFLPSICLTKHRRICFCMQVAACSLRRN